MEGGKTFEYRFEGDDAGTGIPNGSYTLTKLDGISVIIDDTNKKIYKQGTEFYDTYAPKLLTLSHYNALNVILDRTNGGEHALSGSNDSWMEFMRKDNSMVYSYMLSNDVTKISGGEFRAITTLPDERLTEKWTFSYDDYEYSLDELKGYVYSDGVFEEDELGKLIDKSRGSGGGYELYGNGEAVIKIDIYYYANGYGFVFDKVDESSDKDFEEKVEYRVNINTKTLTEIVTDEGFNETESDMPLSEHQDKYDYLLSILPHSYIRRIINMDEAEVIKEKLGLVKNYVMKDENGNIIAEMKVVFGKIGEINHYVSENEYAKIELGY